MMKHQVSRTSRLQLSKFQLFPQIRTLGISIYKNTRLEKHVTRVGVCQNPMLTGASSFLRNKYYQSVFYDLNAPRNSADRVLGNSSHNLRKQQRSVSLLKFELHHKCKDDFVFNLCEVTVLAPCRPCMKLNASVIIMLPAPH